MTTIGLLHYAGPPGVGGVEATMAAHSQQLLAHGYQVRLLAGSGAAFDPRIDFIPSELFGSRGQRIEQINRELANRQITDTFRTTVADTSAALRAALTGVDLLLCHNVTTLHKNLALSAALHQLYQQGHAPPMVAWCHDFAWHDPLYRYELHQGWPWNLLQQVWPRVQYVAVSQDRRNILAELLQIDPSSITVIPPGIDPYERLTLEYATIELLERYQTLAHWPILLLPARITRRKNIEYAIEIVGSLRHQGYHPQLIITGPPGPHNPGNAAYLQQLEQRCRTLQLSDEVVMLYHYFQQHEGQARPASDRMVSDLFRIADALLFPSQLEGFGMPVIEAGLVGLPVFCNDLAPFRESAHDDAVYLNVHTSANHSAHQIITSLINNPQARFRRRVRQDYTWQAIYQQHIQPLLPAA